MPADIEPFKKAENEKETGVTEPEEASKNPPKKEVKNEEPEKPEAASGQVPGESKGPQDVIQDKQAKADAQAQANDEKAAKEAFSEHPSTFQSEQATLDRYQAQQAKQNRGPALGRGSGDAGNAIAGYTQVTFDPNDDTKFGAPANPQIGAPAPSAPEQRPATLATDEPEPEAEQNVRGKPGSGQAKLGQFSERGKNAQEAARLRQHNTDARNARRQQESAPTAEPAQEPAETNIDKLNRERAQQAQEEHKQKMIDWQEQARQRAAQQNAESKTMDFTPGRRYPNDDKGFADWVNESTVWTDEQKEKIRNDPEWRKRFSAFYEPEKPPVSGQPQGEGIMPGKEAEEAGRKPSQTDAQPGESYEDYQARNQKSRLGYWMGTFGDVATATAGIAGRAAEGFGRGYKAMSELAGNAIANMGNGGTPMTLASDATAALGEGLSAVHDGILGKKKMIQNPDGTYREGTELEADLLGTHSPEYYRERDNALMAERYINSTFSRLVEDAARGKDVTQLTDDDVRKIYFGIEEHLRPELERVKQKQKSGAKLTMADQAYLDAYKGIADAWNGYSNGIYRYRAARRNDLNASKKLAEEQKAGYEAQLAELQEPGEEDAAEDQAQPTGSGKATRGGAAGAGNVNNINVSTGGNKQQVKQDNNQQVNVIFNINGQNIPRPAFRQEDGSVVVDFGGTPETVVDASGNPTMPEVVDVVEEGEGQTLDEEFDEEFGTDGEDSEAPTELPGPEDSPDVTQDVFSEKDLDEESPGEDADIEKDPRVIEARKLLSTKGVPFGFKNMSRDEAGKTMYDSEGKPIFDKPRGRLVTLNDGTPVYFDRANKAHLPPEGARVYTDEDRKKDGFIKSTVEPIFKGPKGEIYAEILHENGPSDIAKIINGGLINDEEFCKNNPEFCKKYLGTRVSPQAYLKATGLPQEEVAKITNANRPKKWQTDKIYWSMGYSRRNGNPYYYAVGPDGKPAFASVSGWWDDSKLFKKIAETKGPDELINKIGRAVITPNGYKLTGDYDIYGVERYFAETGDEDRRQKAIEAKRKYLAITGKTSGEDAELRSPSPQNKQILNAPTGAKDIWGDDISGQSGYELGPDGQWYERLGGRDSNPWLLGNYNYSNGHIPFMTLSNVASEFLNADPKDVDAYNRAFRRVQIAALATAIAQDTDPERKEAFKKEYNALRSGQKDIFTPEQAVELAKKSTKQRVREAVARMILEEEAKNESAADEFDRLAGEQAKNPANGAKKEPVVVEDGVKMPSEDKNSQKNDQNEVIQPENKAESPEKVAEMPKNASKWTVEGYKTPSEKDLKDALRELSKDKRIKANGAIAVKDVIDYLGLPQLKRNSPEWTDLVGAIGGAKRAMNKVEGEKVGEKAQKIDEKASSASSADAWEASLRGLGKNLQDEYRANGILDPNMTKEKFVGKFKMPFDIDLASKNWDKVRGAGSTSVPAPTELKESPASSEKEENSPEDAAADELQYAYDKAQSKLKDAYKSMADPRYDQILKDTRVDGINSLYDALIDPETNERAIINYASSLRKRGLGKYVQDLYNRMRQ